MTEAHRSAQTKLRVFDPNLHYLDGGTFVTNLSDDHIGFIEQAIKEYGDPRLFVHDKPCLGGRFMEGWKSLHYLGDEPGNGRWNGAEWGPGFWHIVNRIKERHEEWLKLKDFAP